MHISFVSALPLNLPNKHARPIHRRHSLRMSQKPLPSPKFSRRQVMQLLNAALGTTTLALLFKMRNSFRLMSPTGMLSSLGFSRLPARAATQDPSRLQDAINYIKRIEARPPLQCPDFPRGSDWINSRPLSLNSELKGKLVLLDFFTYCCINCQHVLPKLAALEKKYGQDGSGGVVVVGVHSAKFSAERETANIAAAVDRYDVQHPVINDERLAIWNELGVSSWPTLALVGPKGNVLAVWSGERQEDDIDLIISAALEYYANDIDHRPLPAAPRRNAKLKEGLDSPLRYPGKVALSGDGQWLFVSDSGNHRILQVDVATGVVKRVWGDGEAGWVDAEDGKGARFHSPQGVTERNGVLYVADTESHAVRGIDLKSGKVWTLGGNGEQGFDYAGGYMGSRQQLSSPWDVEVVDEMLYVAMAGTHQIWRVGLKPDQKWEVFSGTGRELEKNASDGRLAGWAQPSHLSEGDGVIYVADSESSCVRSVEVGGSRGTRTLAGGDGLIAENLFAYGDKEGRGAMAKFQHPLGVCYDRAGDRVFVADSYNHRIKTVTEGGDVKVFCGKGGPGLKDGKEAMFWEPGGLALSSDGRKLYVADTNNWVIRVVDTETKMASTMKIKGAEAEQRVVDKPLVGNRRRAVKIACGPVNVEGLVRFEIALPEKAHFTPGTVSRFQVNLRPGDEDSQGVPQVVCLQKGTIAQNGQKGEFSTNLRTFSEKVADAKNLEVEAITYYCTEADDVCRTEADIFDVQLAPGASNSATVAHSIRVRKPRASPAETALR